jgi:hypothetical protein
MVHLALNEVDDDHIAANWATRSPTRSTSLRPRSRFDVNIAAAEEGSRRSAATGR